MLLPLLIKVLSIIDQGYTPPEALCTSLVEFLDSNQFDNDSARKCRTIDVSRSVDLETFTRASGSASDLGTSSTRQEGEDGDEVDAEAIEFMALSGSLGPPLPSPPQQHQNQHGDFPLCTLATIIVKSFLPSAFAFIRAQLWCWFRTTGRGARCDAPTHRPRPQPQQLKQPERAKASASGYRARFGGDNDQK